MKLPRLTTVIISGLIGLLLCSLVCIGILSWHNIVLSWEANNYADEAGFSEATHNFVRGRFWLYQIKPFKIDANYSGRVPDDGELEPSGQTDGTLKIYFMLADQDLGEIHQKYKQAYVDAYNRQMRLYFKRPEWFDRNGLRIPMQKLYANTNAIQ